MDQGYGHSHIPQSALQVQQDKYCPVPQTSTLQLSTEVQAQQCHLVVRQSITIA